MKRFNVWAALLLGLISILCPTNQAHAQLYGIEWDTGDLYTISTVDASLTLVGSTGIINLGSLEYRASEGLLYANTVGSSPTLYSIDPVTAIANAEGNVSGGLLFEGGLAIAPSGTAYTVNGGSAAAAVLKTIDLDTGLTATVGVISGGSHDINGLGVRSDGMLIGLDRESNSLLEINPGTAVSSAIQALRPTVGALGGISLVADDGYFVTAGPTVSIPGSNRLYSFDPFTGAYTSIGNFNATITGDGFSGIALVPVPEPSSLLLLLTIGASLFGRRRSR